ncbi:MAG: DNA primase [SAR324 cluster bacterium]|uniref:DNA primase n=1 Tax=SAR324 cluster bacterium TaxID=2024889 RepID=A0A7X9FT94_9DELT|nr:DNA primase [SAR324 cluster bacterium]
MISADTIEEVKTKAKIVDIASEYLELKRQGNRLVALCPFHGEKTPSFHIRPEYNTYHCFGCGVSGNVISFLMELRGVSFPEAIEELASRYGIDIKREKNISSSNSGNLKKELFKLNSLAESFFLKNLKDAPKEVIEYLKERRLLSETINEFRIGLAPPGRDLLFRFLRSKKVSEDLILKSGLCRRSEKGDFYDTFRARLIFPIRSDLRHIAGFGGRSIPALNQNADASLPKYINSPESPIYEKHKTLYGLPHSMPSIRAQKEVYVVEGYLDLIGLWQVGVRNVVATCGTAFTLGHVERLSHIAKKVLMLFDGDKAGRDAAGKCFPLFLNSGIEAKALFLNAEDDPDSVAKKLNNQTAEFLSKLERHELLDCYIEFLVKGYGFDASEGGGDLVVGELAKDIVAILKKVKDPIVRDRLTQSAAFKLRVNADLFSRSVEEGHSEDALNEPAFLSELREKETQAEDSVVEIGKLSRVEQELLSALMVYRDILAPRVLNDADLCRVVNSSILLFTQGLATILEQSETLQKAETKRLLQRFGVSWLEHWRKAYSMAERAGVNLLASFEDCCIALKKEEVRKQISQIDKLLQRSSEEDEKIFLLQEKLNLSRKLKDLAQGS